MRRWEQKFFSSWQSKQDISPLLKQNRETQIIHFDFPVENYVQIVTFSQNALIKKKNAMCSSGENSLLLETFAGLGRTSLSSHLAPLFLQSRICIPCLRPIQSLRSVEAHLNSAPASKVKYQQKICLPLCKKQSSPFGATTKKK